MKIIIAPDSFKGSLRSPEVCEAVAKGLRRALPNAQLISIPMADGGEGTTRAAVIATGGELHTRDVHGPLMQMVSAEYGLLDNDIAIFEMASASGLELLEDSKKNPLETTTFGTGQILRRLLERGFRDIIMGIGGSATVDGGMGMLQALGYRMVDADGELLPFGIGGGTLHRIARIDCSHADPRLKECRIRVACDVTNPLLGPNGAAAVFGPQKGASPEDVSRLEYNLKHWFEVLRSADLCKNCDQPGDGAAGGLGFALRNVLNAEITSGAALLIDLADLTEQLAGADLLITGEGCSDSQTAQGKLCAVIAETAAHRQVPAILLSGALRGDLSELEKIFAGTFSIARGPGSLADAMASTAANLEFTAFNIAKLLSSVVAKN